MCWLLRHIVLDTPIDVLTGFVLWYGCRWISAACRSLTTFVRQEMSAYRLYTVVPYLVQFVDSLTNVYVRYNRKRLKVRADAASGMHYGMYDGM